MPLRATSAAHSRPTPREWVLPAAALAGLALLACLPAMSGGFFWDDYTCLVQNPLIHAPDGLRRLWLTREAAEYLPLTYSTLWLEWRLWSGAAAGFHVVNALLHAAGAVLLWRVLRRLNVPGAWLAGALFAVHPVAMASAGWIIERKNVLSLAFCAGSLLAYLRFDEKEGSRSPIEYLLSVFLFLLALLSKTSVVMLPVVLLLCAWWRRGKIARRDALRALPFFALSLALGLATVWFQWHAWTPGAGWAAVRPEGLALRAASAGWIAWFYLFKLLLPAGLSPIYPRWNIGGAGLLSFLPTLLLLGGMVFLWTRRKSWGRGPFFGAACFLVMLLPALGLLDMSFMQYSLAADHLQYAAMIGILAVAAGVLVRAGGRAAMPAAAGCVAVLAILAWQRATLYGDEKLLWRDNVAKNPAAWAAWDSLGGACSRAGLHVEAIRCEDRAVALKPGAAALYYNRGVAEAAAGRLEESLPDYDRAIALKPDYAAAYFQRSLACGGLGKFEEAARGYSAVLALKPDDAVARYDRGAAYARVGRAEDALSDFERAIELKPDYAEAYNGEALVYYQRKEYGRAREAEKTFEKLGGTPDGKFMRALTAAAGGGNREE